MAATITRRSYSLLSFSLLLSIFHTSASASAQNGILNIRQDTTCSGGVCGLGNVCCGNGCMFSTGVCCAGDGDYFCYQGETCQGPNDVGDVDCCSDGTCTPAKFVIYYEDSGAGGGSASGSSAPTSTPASQAAPSSQPSTENTSAAAPTTSPLPGSSQTSSAAPSTSAAGPTTAQSAAPTGGAAGGSSTSSAAPASTSKSSAARLPHIKTLEGGVSLLLLALIYCL